ncbi:MAG TPA: hypothetical protein VH186_05315 [Chloroflexia bacterium]|nr:hypothetical protein [Chloroflexia bacterium]
MPMKKVDGSGAGEETRPTGPLKKMLTSGVRGSMVPYRERTFDRTQLIVPLILVLALLIGVAILAYSFGVSQGKSSANSERDKFYESRAASWQGTATAGGSAANPASGTTPGAGNPTGTGSGFTQGNSTYGRVDSIDGDKVVVLVLNASGAPTGTSVVISVSKQTQVWRSVPSQNVDLKIGDTILFVGDRNNSGSFDARSILVLPPPS